MPYNFVADGFHTKNFVTDSVPKKCNFAFWASYGAYGNVRCSS